MKKKTIIIIIVAVLLIIGIAAWAMRDEIKKLLGKKAPAGDGDQQWVYLYASGLQDVDPEYDTAALRKHLKDWNLNPDLLLKKGDNSREIVQLQSMLNKIETTQTIIPDGKFGSLTEAKLYRAIGQNTTSLMQIGTKYKWKFS